MYHTSIYRRLILQAKTYDVNTATTGASLHTRFRENAEGTNLLNFSTGHLYNGKIAKRYGHAPMPFATFAIIFPVPVFSQSSSSSSWLSIESF